MPVEEVQRFISPSRLGEIHPCEVSSASQMSEVAAIGYKSKRVDPGCVSIDHNLLPGFNYVAFLFPIPTTSHPPLWCGVEL